MILLVITTFLCQVLGKPVPIIKGRPSNIVHHPWLVSIQRNGFHFCGGSILSDSIILTAGHCITNDPLNSITVRVGSSRTDSGGSCHNVVAMKRHENYTNREHHIAMNDLGLMKVSPPIRFDSSDRSVTKIQLAEKWDVVTPGSSASVAGWGMVTREGGLAPDVRKTFLRIVDNRDCSKSWGYTSGNLVKSTKQICATAVEYGSNTCFGDSGNPLIANYIQIGIAVSGSCGNPMYPAAIYIDVACFRDWIDENSALMKFKIYT